MHVHIHMSSCEESGVSSIEVAGSSGNHSHLSLLLATDNYNRVHLQMSPGVGGSDYINASYIDVRICVSRKVYLHEYDVET